MAGFARLTGFAIAATGGYVAGRRHHELMAALERVRAPHDGPPSRRVRGWEDETEYEHAVEREAAQRHTLAEAIKRHPLRQRPTGQEGKGRKGWPGRPQRPDDELRYPRSY